ncbi:MAG: hypothetical protein EXR55_02095 [Dehalococcoidia bacterium]|nr:hypothetical protein [Dehalococcoidia bacterium]
MLLRPGPLRGRSGRGPPEGLPCRARHHGHGRRRRWLHLARPTGEGPLGRPRGRSLRGAPPSSQTLTFRAPSSPLYEPPPNAPSGALSEEQVSQKPLSQQRERTLGLWNNGSLRAAILGVNDGLVSNFSLVMGVAGGTGDPRFVLLAGGAGLMAGAFSMAAGEYVSMRAQRDLSERLLELEARELLEEPEEETEELVLIYQRKGLTRQEAETVAKRIMADPIVALDTHAREELGLDPSQLGSPWAASLSSFAAFAGGAFVPILPYLASVGDSAFLVSIVLSAVALVAVGTLLAYLSGKRVWWGALRMLLAGGIAAGVTFTIGSLLGVALA